MRLEDINTQSTYAFLWSLIKTEHKAFTLGLITAILACGAEVAVYFIVFFSAQAVLDKDSQELFWLAGVIGLLIISRLALMSGAYWLCHLAAYRIVQRVRELSVRQLARAPLAELTKWHRSDLEKRVLRDSNRLTLLLAHYGVETLSLLLQPILFIALIGWLDWRLALVALAPLPIALWLQVHIMKAFPERQVLYNQSVARIDKAVFDFVQGASVLKQFLKDQDSLQQLDTAIHTHHALLQTYTRQLIQGWTSFTTVSRCSVFFVVPFGGWLWSGQQISDMAFGLTVILSLALMKPWLLATQMFGKTMEALDALNQLLPLLNIVEEVSEMHPSPTQFTLCADHLTLGLADRVLINDLSLELKLGMRLAVIGESGCGKSTFAQSLMGMIALKSGAWRLDNVSLQTCSAQQRAQWIAMAAQQTFLFRGSLRDNLLLDRINSTSQEFVDRVLQVCELTSVIEQMPQGLDTDVGEASRLLSGGETQRLGLARALLRNTPILILDEVTAHLDTVTELRLLDNLSQAFPNQTQIIISHRANVRDYCHATLELPSTTFQQHFYLEQVEV
ncbi:ABC transporter ATP-binding protein [Marinomonas transparens]|uniref:ABC transporter ATP-binding protein n=1 Tax=Marinomonas transparens TaxID=2795388 RepID=A0A934JQ58_9GAMM|nr:ABC transporter ATP-binding protein [Marinomonas transparens]MBJ7536372.1 ABC transporter ATP-binding protein [Marinomonas transparens]